MSLSGFEERLSLLYRHLGLRSGSDIVAKHSLESCEKLFIVGVGTSRGGILQSFKDIGLLGGMGRVVHKRDDTLEGIFINSVLDSLTGRLHQLGHLDD